MLLVDHWLVTQMYTVSKKRLLLHFQMTPKSQMTPTKNYQFSLHFVTHTGTFGVVRDKCCQISLFFLVKKVYIHCVPIKLSSTPNAWHNFVNS